MIDKMTRYDFILLSSGAEAFLSRIQSLGVVDVTRSVKAIDDKSAAMFSEAEDLRRRITLLEKEDFGKDAAYAALSADLAAAEKEAALRRHWGDFDKATVAALEAAGQKLHFFCVPAKKYDSFWQEQYPAAVIENDGKYVWLVCVGDSTIPSQYEIAAPQGPASETEASLEQARQALLAREDELRALKADIPAMKAEYASRMADFDFYLASCATAKVAEDSISVITAFAPSDNDEALKAEFDACDEVYWTSSAADVQDDPPIKLRNNGFVRMFEVLTDMYGRPAYNGFDPTPYISVFFLLFFAICMGDAGYGFILMIAGLLLKKVKSFASLAPLVVTLGAGTVVVGFFFHTFFSVDISAWECIPDALKSVMVPAKISTYDGTMVLALVIGVIHLCLAMVVKTVYATKNEGFLKSLGTWGWTLLIVGGVVLVAIALTGVIDSAVTKIALIVLGVISGLGIFLFNDTSRNPLSNIGSGLWATYNTATGVLGDVLSYLRLYALGLAGSMLGFAFNDLAKLALGDGGFGWVPFILIVVIGHTLNLAMAALGAFVHPLRLNFLEFFKNSGYEAAGRNYNPLAKSINK